MKYQELPAQPGMVFNSNGKTVSLSISSKLTTSPKAVFQAQSFALPKGGFPSSVGKYFSTSGNLSGKCSVLSANGIPDLK